MSRSWVNAAGTSFSAMWTVTGTAIRRCEAMSMTGKASAPLWRAASSAKNSVWPACANPFQQHMLRNGRRDHGGGTPAG